MSVEADLRLPSPISSAMIEQEVIVTKAEEKCKLDDSDVYAPDDFVEELDPRVQVELENLNTLTDLINTLELELDDSRSGFRHLLSDSSQKINSLAKKLGSCVEKSKCYYDARIKAKELQNETQKAAVRYERASSTHMAAKEMVCLSEEGLNQEGRIFDPAWQEMLNHATIKVNDAERERVASQREHLMTSHQYIDAERQVAILHRNLKRSIGKASLSARQDLLKFNNLVNQHQLQLLPYFEMKAQFNHMMDAQIQIVRKVEAKVAKAKKDYSAALKRLENISYEIHERRKLRNNREQRGVGVGAESPVPPGSPDLSSTLRKLNLSHSTVSPIKSPQSPRSGDLPNLSQSAPGLPWSFYQIGPGSYCSSSRAMSERDDCESVASSDTMDTLDESTIEKLMLERSIESEFKDIFVNSD